MEFFNKYWEHITNKNNLKIWRCRKRFINCNGRPILIGLTNARTFKLNQSLTCADFGIYVATCVICHEQHAGQTSKKFSKRWSAHRSNWNKQDCKTDSGKDQMALSRHYSENHGTINKPPLHEAYTVTFVEQPSCHSLDICENKWYNLIDAQINIQNMILPHVK